MSFLCPLYTESQHHVFSRSGCRVKIRNSSHMTIRPCRVLRNPCKKVIGDYTVGDQTTEKVHPECLPPSQTDMTSISN